MVVHNSMPEFSMWARPTPPPGSRIKSEGVANYQRNRGTLGQVAFQQVASSYPCTPTSASSADPPKASTFTPRNIPRCPTSASRANYKLSVFGNVRKVLSDAATSRPHTAPPRVKPEAEATANISKGVRMRPIIHQQPRRGSVATPRVPRVKPEAEGIASVSKGKRMRTIVHEYAQRGSTPRVPRVKAEAEATAEVAKGGRMHNVIHKYGTLPLSSRAVPRVKPEGEDNATLDMGKRMGRIIHKYGRNEATPRAPPRVKVEGADNAELDRGKRMATVLHSYTHPRSARREPRVKPEAARSAELDRGFRMEKLVHSGHTLPSSPRPASRAIGSQAQRNLYKGVTGSVGKCLRDSGRKTCVYVPGEQSRRYSTPSVM